MRYFNKFAMPNTRTFVPELYVYDKNITKYTKYDAFAHRCSAKQRTPRRWALEVFGDSCMLKYNITI